MCIGRSPDEALALVLEALPTALSCDFVYLALGGTPPRAHAALGSRRLGEDDVAAIEAAIAAPGDADGRRDIPGAGALHCLEVALPMGSTRGRLVAGRTAPMNRETDRVLVRSAANLAGTTLETANVLDAARRKDEFLAILGHELRNPLAPIMTAVELVAREPCIAREREIIERNTRHLARLVDDLLDISRVTRGHIELQREQVRLGFVLERAVELANALVARNRHSLRVGDAGDLVVRGDPVRLAQVFGNLLTNAAKFTPPRGNIELSIERRGGRARVTVRDDGRGIAADKLGRIFEPFVQADRERDALSGGLGLGLAIVKNLVDRHGGTISVESGGLGHGATFTVELPVEAATEIAPAAPQPKPAVVRRGIRVLVVDDNADLAELLAEALQSEGFETDVAHDGHAALERWRRFSPHAAVLDVGLPELDGYSLARTIRTEHGPGPTLIAATGYGRGRDRKLAADAGFDAHFVKPVSIRDLVRVLDERIMRAAVSA
jgi:signal transduction histidine kinase/CheY-like chemotaxis protein